MDEKGEKVAARAAVKTINCFWGREKAEYGASDEESRGVVSTIGSLSVEVAGGAADALADAKRSPYLLAKMCAFIAINGFVRSSEYVMLCYGEGCGLCILSIGAFY